MNEVRPWTDYQVAIIGNALLLAGKLVEASVRTKVQDQSSVEDFRKEVVGYGELRKALYAAGQLDGELANAIDITKDDLGRGAENSYHRLSEILSGGAEITKVRLEEFEFPTDLAGRYGIAEAIVGVDPEDAGRPIVQLRPSQLTSAVRDFVIDYMKDLAAEELGLSREQAYSVGLDGLVTRRKVTEPPNWYLWNSPAARRTRSERAWLEELREKARRHILWPAKQAYDPQVEDHNTAGLGQHLANLGASGIKERELPVCGSLGDLVDKLLAKPFISAEVVSEHFPSYGALYPHSDYRPDADPYNFLLFISAQILWQGIQDGWVLCFAEDGLKSKDLTWIPPKVFPSLSENNELALPEEIGLSGCFDLEERAKATLKADRLWFALIDDLAAALPILQHQEAEVDEQPVRKRSYNKGFTTSDAPFIEEGLEMLTNGVAKSALNAAQRLIAIHGEVTEVDWDAGKEGIRSYTLGAAETRLQRAIAKARKERSR